MRAAGSHGAGGLGRGLAFTDVISEVAPVQRDLAPRLAGLGDRAALRDLDARRDDAWLRLVRWHTGLRLLGLAPAGEIAPSGGARHVAR